MIILNQDSLKTKVEPLSPMTEVFARLKAGEIIIPTHDLVYRAFELTPMNAVKVVVLGQDPYLKPEDATGLAFSVPPHRPIPASLSRIFKVLEDCGYSKPTNGDLTPWAKKGVLLLNSALTTLKGKPGSHLKIWKSFTINVIEALNARNEPTIYWLMGKHAQSFAPYIRNGYIYKSPHPSPANGNKFLKDKHFSNINRILDSLGRSRVDWNLE